MIALDTNVLVRVVTADDPGQTAAALALLRRPGSFWVSKTVLLETAWVLSITYRLDRAAVARVFTRILGFRRMAVEDRDAVLRALARFEAGLDIADALHLASSAEAELFATFDRSLAQAAGRMPGGPAVELLAGS
jgi:predicted nucleic-acid-binding protein